MCGPISVTPHPETCRLCTSGFTVPRNDFNSLYSPVFQGIHWENEQDMARTVKTLAVGIFHLTRAEQVVWHNQPQLGH